MLLLHQIRVWRTMRPKHRLGISSWRFGAVGGAGELCLPFTTILSVLTYLSLSSESASLSIHNRSKLVSLVNELHNSIYFSRLYWFIVCLNLESARLYTRYSCRPPAIFKSRFAFFLPAYNCANSSIDTALVHYHRLSILYTFLLASQYSQSLTPHLSFIVWRNLHRECL